MAGTNVPQPSWTALGFIAPQALDVLDGVLADTNAAFGGELNMELTTPQGQLSSSEAAVIDNVNALFVRYTNQVDPAFAVGRMQDAIGRIYFIARKAAQPTVTKATCIGLAGVVIPPGSLAIADDGNQYICTDGGIIPVSGSIDLSFECALVGPVPCPAGSLNQIYRSIPGWDAIDNAQDGVIGSLVESRAQFEARRAQSVALNSAGSLPSVRGAVLDVDNVLDAYVTENATNDPITVSGVTIAPNSLFVSVVGGDADEVARAIWTRKAPGCAYNGNTTVTVLDDSSGYAPPYPAYSVSFTRPTPLEIFFSVKIFNSTLVPANAKQLVQDAIVAAFSGADGGQRARIGGKLLASRFYAPVQLLGDWAQIESIEIGSINSTDAVFTASIAGTTMTVTAVASGALAPDQSVTDAFGNVSAGTTIVSQSSGSTGSTGTYVISNSLTVAAQTMQSVTPDLFDFNVHIDQVPVISAANIDVDLI
jgi:hypothetical protein